MNPLHDPSKLLPTQEPSSPNSPANLPTAHRLKPNSDFPRGWPTSTKYPPKRNPNESTKE